ncbi:MAG: PIN domain-containing protein [Candidatus Aenigmarchaeota archaeon]|nr:PIN domain-containing protein [Candidatus Aenigmarchaeota archaeon]
MKKIVFDTNFLIDCFRFKVDFLKEIEEKIEKPYKFLVLEQNLKELEKIAKTNKKEAKYAKLALQFVKSNCELISVKEKSTDKAILKFSDKDTFVATNDRKLRKSLKTLGIKNIYLKSLKKLEVG